MDKYIKVFNYHNIYPVLIYSYRQAPMCPGVYIITKLVDNEEIIEYIGSSCYLRRRLNSHSVLLRLKRENHESRLYFIATTQKAYLNLEYALIDDIKPASNKAMPKVKHI